MTFAANVLVTALDDKGRFVAVGGVDIALAGALLIGDLLGGRSLRDLTGLDGDPVEAVSNRTRGVVSIVGAQAISSGLVSEVEQRVLGLFPRRRYAVADVAGRDQLVAALRQALAVGGRPDREGAAYAVVCAVSGIARRWVGSPASPEERAALAGQINDLCAVAGEPVTAIVRAIRTCYGRREASGADASPLLLLPVDGSEDYGDTGPSADWSDASSGAGSDGGSDGAADGGGGSDGGGGGGD